jgi:hypothetical protein
MAASAQHGRWTPTDAQQELPETGARDWYADLEALSRERHGDAGGSALVRGATPMIARASVSLWSYERFF